MQSAGKQEKKFGQKHEKGEGKKEQGQKKYSQKKRDGKKRSSYFLLLPVWKIILWGTRVRRPISMIPSTGLRNA